VNLTWQASTRRIALIALRFGLSDCASLTPRDPLRVEVVGIEPLSGQGLELRMAVKLGMLNPNNTPIAYDGAFCGTGRAGQTLGQRRQQRARQRAALWRSRADRASRGGAAACHGHCRWRPVAGRLRGALSGPLFNSHRFTSQGEFKLPAALLGNAP